MARKCLWSGDMHVLLDWLFSFVPLLWRGGREGSRRLGCPGLTHSSWGQGCGYLEKPAVVCQGSGLVIKRLHRHQPEISRRATILPSKCRRAWGSSPMRGWSGRAMVGHDGTAIHLFLATWLGVPPPPSSFAYALYLIRMAAL